MRILPNVQAAGLIVVLVVFLLSCKEESPENKPVKVSKTEKTSKELVQKVPEKVHGYLLDSVKIITDKIKPNQSLGEILGPHNVSSSVIYEIANASKTVFDVRKFRAHADYDIICSKKDGTPKCFVYHPNAVESVVFKLDDSVTVNIERKEIIIKEKTASGAITSSLYKAIVDMGARPELANKLADVYAWQVDFFALQKEDEFTVVYEEKYVDDELIGIGNILAARFRHTSKDYYGFRYKQSDSSGIEYFDEEGNSLQKTFLKAPLSYSRISSHFSHSRLHPVLKIRRPHHGVDYAAPRGTPVVSIGDGVVIHAKYSGGAGNYIKIKHNSIYTTGYMHLQKFASGIKVGSHVKQGELIAYVGNTGLSTGPHLDFRFWKSGEAVDPLKVDPPSAEPIEEKNRTEFNKVRDKFMNRLVPAEKGTMALK